MRSLRARSVVLAVALAVPLAGIGCTAPADAASVPITVSAVPGNGRATVSWTIGKKPAIRYLILEAWINGRKTQRDVGPKAWQHTAVFPKLKNGIKYVFRLRVEYKSSLDWFGYNSPGVRIGVPLPPTNVHAASDGPGTVTVSVTAPNNNGSPITQYMATCTSSNGGATKSGVSQAPAVPTVIVSGLTAGHAYRCLAWAKNVHGQSAHSAQSNSVAV